MTALTDLVAAMELVVAAGQEARRTGVDQDLGCGRCRVDAVLDTVSFDLGCQLHAELRSAYLTQRASRQSGAGGP